MLATATAEDCVLAIRAAEKYCKMRKINSFVLSICPIVSPREIIVRTKSVALFYNLEKARERDRVTDAAIQNFKLKYRPNANRILKRKIKRVKVPILYVKRVKDKNGSWKTKIGKQK